MMPLKIERLFAFIAKDELTGDEGVCGFQSDMGWMPMVGADQAMIDKLRPMARSIAKASGKEIVICRFSIREEIETIGG
jgi:hypothetical protein